jgi:exopolysaccharide biosynthesis polyprenyl glycosylphosphotransferase
LDCLTTLAVFNIVSHYWGVSNHLIIGPAFVPLGILMVAIALIDGYQIRTDMLSVDYTSLHAIAVISAMVATLLLTYVFIPGGFELQSSRGAILVSFSILIPFTLGYRRLLYAPIAAARSSLSLIYIGDYESSMAFHNECVAMGTKQPIIYASIGTLPPFPTTGLRLRPFRDVLDSIQAGELSAGAIVLRESNRELNSETSKELIHLYFKGLPTYTLELFHQVYWQKIPLYRLNQTWLFQEGFQIAREPVFERIKRCSDIILAGIGLILAALPIAAAALAIRLEDRGPILFKQTRVGKNRVLFQMLKLRSMRTDAGKGSKYTQVGDNRITRVGKFLRSSRVDELPQLWNVLVGHMSLIGPRAEWDRLVDEYEETIPCYHFRHLVKPGITGWAQVNYPYGANLEDTLRKLEYDLYYIRHFSFLLDASIVLKTVHVMLFGKGR